MSEKVRERKKKSKKETVTKNHLEFIQISPKCYVRITQQKERRTSPKRLFQRDGTRCKEARQPLQIRREKTAADTQEGRGRARMHDVGHRQTQRERDGLSSPCLSFGAGVFQIITFILITVAKLVGHYFNISGLSLISVARYAIMRLELDPPLADASGSRTAPGRGSFPHCAATHRVVR